MTQERGHLSAVDQRWDGDELTAAALVNATVLTVGDVADFDEEGGWLRLNGVIMPYLTIDDTLATITLANPLAAAAAVEDRVEVWDADNSQPVTEYVGHVILDGQEDGDPVEASIDHALVPLLTQTIRTEGGESVVLDWDGDDLRIVKVDGKQPIGDATYIDPDTLPDITLPTAPPATSPALTVTGAPNALIIRADEVAASTEIEYHISTTDGFIPSGATLSVTTRATVYVLEKLPDGSPLQLDTTYYLRAVAKNIIGSAAAGTQAFAQLDVDAVRTVVAAEVVAGFILAGRIQVGVAYIDAEEGLVIPQPGGGTITLPVDGVTPAQITAHLIARSLTVEDNANFYGLTQLFGTVRLANGVTNPTQPAGVSRTWPNLVIGLVSGQDILYGLTDNSAGTSWLSTFAFGGLWILAADKTTGGVLNTQVTGTNLNLFQPSGITRLSSTYYVLGQDLARDGRWFVYIIDGGTFAKTGEWEYTQESTGKRPAIGNDGTNVAIARWNTVSGTDRIVVRTFTPATGAIQTTTTCNSPTPKDLTGLFVGTADFGATRIIATWSQAVLAFNSSGGSQPTHAWARAAAAPVRGLYWDGTRFHHLDTEGNVWHYSRRPTTATVDVAYTWYDGDAGGTGTHETMASPLTSFSWSNRSWLSVEHPPAPQVAETSNPDAADQSRGYVAATGSAVRLQATPAVGTRTYTIDILDTLSATAPASNNFPPSAVPGTFESAATDAEGALTKLDGAGFARIKGTDGWDNLTISGLYTAGSPTPQYRKDPVGNVHLRGQINVNTAADGDTAFTLPTGYRPTGTTRRINDTLPLTSQGRFLINSDGTVTLHRRGQTTGSPSDPAPTQFFIDCVFSTY
ncbi:hypothetical protein [Nocardioides speluncae]|uniref:hypothetical protein n=1 Tax=Nocardioides speluncae TaxID=2670337 RepID=UPI000D695385|nr:hypothetical protein [Nocardioides speluncae]